MLRRWFITVYCYRFTPRLMPFELPPAEAVHHLLHYTMVWFNYVIQAYVTCRRWSRRLPLFTEPRTGLIVW